MCLEFFRVDSERKGGQECLELFDQFTKKYQKDVRHLHWERLALDVPGSVCVQERDGKEWSLAGTKDLSRLKYKLFDSKEY